MRCDRDGDSVRAPAAQSVSLPNHPCAIAPRQLARPGWPPGRSRLSPADTGVTGQPVALPSPRRANHRRDLDPSARAWAPGVLCLCARDAARPAWAKLA